MQRAQLKIDLQSDEPVWTPARQDLWRRVEQHDFEPLSPLNFTRRLARDHSWSLEGARAAVDAYRRFCFLAVVSPTPVTPSEIVDEVWHQHLIYSRDYWMIWCGERLQAPLQRHHPVGFLIFLLIATAIGTFVLAKRPTRTRAGNDVLQAIRLHMREPCGRRLITSCFSRSRSPAPSSCRIHPTHRFMPRRRRWAAEAVMEVVAVAAAGEADAAGAAVRPVPFRRRHCREAVSDP